MDMKLEAFALPVSDVDRSKHFYAGLGWRQDADFRFDNGFRVVQFTPPGSGCSIQFGAKLTSAKPGSAQGLYLVVSDIDAARKELIADGVEVSEVFHAGDIVAREHWCSSGFANTDLDLLLKRHGIERIIVIGLIAHTCVEATVRFAAELGYDVTMVSDATADLSDEFIHASFVNIPSYASAVVTTQQVVEALSIPVRLKQSA